MYVLLSEMDFIGYKKNSSSSDRRLLGSSQTKTFEFMSNKLLLSLFLFLRKWNRNVGATA